eukprot:CAMPEP_0178613636 /NCGR_PEP_ID=MMETSP0698-20121128/1747_1 /TAXON_ID=265572 /ORGANISM="Extubocellulus spinifer, Strain CCMP396" /LENGTH=867 /DNA_ID=CAMNT_0020252339 /DNA_START=571 /DNA_END=3174 /DNA_ORIENTATION=-
MALPSDASIDSVPLIFDEISMDSLPSPLSTDACSAHSTVDTAEITDNNCDEIAKQSVSSDTSINSIPLSSDDSSIDSVTAYIPDIHVDEMAIPLPHDIPDTQVDAIADLNAVIGAAGIHVLSCLPTGDLINGYRSPSLVSSMFHKTVHKALGQREVLSFSGCSHLRKINDDALIRLMRTIIEVSEADHPGLSRLALRQQDHDCLNSSSCPSRANALHFLDLGRCRHISGKAVHFVLKHTPNIRRLSLVWAVRFDAAMEFRLPRDRDIAPFSNLSVLHVPKLETIDISGCSQVDALGVRALTAFITGYQSRHLNISDISGSSRNDALAAEFSRNLEYVGINTLTAYVAGHQIRHLDLSCCSTTLDDNIAPPIAECCRHLEVLGLAGLKKLTSFGVGLMAYCCRDTLRDLTLRDCENVNLTEIVLPTMLTILDVCHEHPNTDRNGLISLLPPSFVQDAPDDMRALQIYAVSLQTAVMQLRETVNEEDLVLRARTYEVLFKAFDERLTNGERKSETHLFGMLEKLDVSNIGKSRRLQGCLSAIAWSSGGRLRHVNVSGLSTVTDADLLTVATTSGPRLKVLEASSSLSMIIPRAQIVPAREAFSAASNISELDLSGCKSFLDRIYSFPSDVVSLRLDLSPVQELALMKIFRLKKLLKLSIVGCPEVSTSSICLYAKVFSPVLLELDAREVEVDTPWDEVQEKIPSLLRLNKRRTARGTKMIAEHVRIERWRNGGRDPRKTGKRKYDGNKSTAPSPASTLAASSNVGDAETNIQSCCSILRTGFCTDTDTEQEMFACRTCRIEAKRFVCFACASKCHKGHDVVPVGFGCGYCDCSILSKCDCLQLDEEEKEDANANNVPRGSDVPLFAFLT